MTPTAEASDWRAGDRVSCNWKSLGTYYTGTIAARMGKKVSVFYDDGDREITTTSRCSRIGPPRNASKSGKVGGLSVGARVQCNWKNLGVYYSGKIVGRDGKKLKIHYDDGDRETTTIGRCRKP